MTPRETVVLTRYVAACCPQQAIDEYTPDAWFDLLGDLDAADCTAAVREIGKRQPFIAPAEIRAEVKRQRRDRLDRAIVPAPPAAIADDPGRYRAALESGIRGIADGRSVRKAIGGPVRKDGPPEGWAEARARFGASIEASREHLTPEQIARQQAAESRAERAGCGDPMPEADVA
jgi:hypothetical protein